VTVGRVRVGVDTGGTFTDVVVERDGAIEAFKIVSTPDDPSRAILAALDRVLGAGAAGRVELVHGTTVATNALLERKGAATALVTTSGFEDLLLIGRQARPRLYDLGVTRPEPIVSPDRSFGLDERVGPDGTVVRAPEPAALDALAAAVAASGAESVAVCLLFSFANPAHEREIEARLEALGLPVSASYRLLPEYREYERAATVAVNAYLTPRMRAYLDRLSTESRCRSVASLRVMQSSGGSISAETAAREPVRTILSGPAGGAVAAGRLARLAGLGDLVTLDMGGTSTDVALVVEGEARVTGEAHVAGLPVAVPVVDIHTVGAGGGSIARVDAGGALKVGPESAGADPGPACYGRGEEPTVTDANVVLGRLPSLLGGAMALDADRAHAALARLATRIAQVSGRACDAEAAALGVVRVAGANMERALRVVSVERGYDPRGASLLGFGGAGGLHACALATALGMSRVVVPPFPGAFSALGLLLGDVVRDVSRTVAGLASTPDEIEAIFRSLAAAADEALAVEGVPPERRRLERSAAMRYRGQSFEIDVAWGEGAEAAFHDAHRARYGHADPRRPVEVVHLRVRGVGLAEPLELPRAGSAEPHEAGVSGVARVRFETGWEELPTYSREALGAGAAATGPALVLEYGSTTLVERGWRLEVDTLGCLLLTKERP
jgi:N-methylhydantoinase A